MILQRLIVNESALLVASLKHSLLQSIRAIIVVTLEHVEGMINTITLHYFTFSATPNGILVFHVEFFKLAAAAALVTDFQTKLTCKCRAPGDSSTTMKMGPKQEFDKKYLNSESFGE